MKIGIVNNCSTPQESLDLLCEVLFPGSGAVTPKVKPNNSIKLMPEGTILFSKENIIKIFVHLENLKNLEGMAFNHPL